jgi:hypothetical protein
MSVIVTVRTILPLFHSDGDRSFECKQNGVEFSFVIEFSCYLYLDASTPPYDAKGPLSFKYVFTGKFSFHLCINYVTSRAESML